MLATPEVRMLDADALDTREVRWPAGRTRARGQATAGRGRAAGGLGREPRQPEARRRGADAIVKLTWIN